MQNLSVSVIVGTKDRQEPLKICLQSIVSSSYPYKELIVVDSSDDPVRAMNEELVGKLGGKYCYEPVKGFGVARNTGIKLASGDLLVFADDDFIVTNDWIRNLVVNFDDPEVVCCTGRMLPYRNDGQSRLYERTFSFDRGDKMRIYTRKDMSIPKLARVARAAIFAKNRSLHDKAPPPGIGGGFFSFRRNLFDEIGYFQDLHRGALTGGEDTEIFYRILKTTNYRIVYEPAAVIYHNHPQTTEAVLRWIFLRGARSPMLYMRYPKDLYLLLDFIGDVLLSLLVLIKATLKSDWELKKAMVTYFKGLIKGAKPDR